MVSRIIRKTVDRFDVFWVALDPTVGREVQKTRPCVVVSPDAINQLLGTVIVAPITSKPRHHSCRVAVTLRGKKGEVMLDQIRSVDKSRLTEKIGVLDEKSGMQLLNVLTEMFAW
jgi:mRNA interferase MazF